MIKISIFHTPENYIMDNIKKYDFLQIRLLVKNFEEMRMLLNIAES